VLVVDSSDSMGEGAQARMRAAKGVVLALLHDAYQNRSEVALIVFGGEQARVVLPPTRSVRLAIDRLHRLPTGGATPFADGLFKAWQLVRRERLKNPAVRPILVIFSDGEANVPMIAGSPPRAELLALAGSIARDQISTVLIDVVTEPAKAAELHLLARHLRASYAKASDLKPRTILAAVEEVGVRLERWGAATAGCMGTQ